MDLTLPLSWITTTNKTFSPKIKKLTLSRTKWITSAEVPKNKNVTDLIAENFSAANKLIIRGCETGLAEDLSNLGFRKILVGREAILNLNNNLLEKKSLRKLINRGSKKGNVFEIGNYNDYKFLLDDLIADSSHSKEPQLKYLFITNLNECNRVFVFQSEKNNKLLGAIGIAPQGEGRFHTEVLMRRKNSPPGIMELLIAEISKKLKSENHQILSLGEIPFFNIEPKTFYEKLVQLTGKKLKFAYNYEGLFKFKNKFNPQWEDIYMCVRPKLKINLLFSLFISTNLYRLVLYKLYYFVP